MDTGNKKMKIKDINNYVGNQKQEVDYSTYEEQENIGDRYDLYKQAIKVHSPIPEVTSDFTLSNLDDELLKNKLIRFLKEQIKMVHIIKGYLRQKDEPVYNEKGEIIEWKVSELVKYYTDDTCTLLLKEAYTIVIMSRAKKGEIIKGIVQPYLNELEIAQQDDQEQGKTKEKLLARRDKKEEVQE